VAATPLRVRLRPLLPLIATFAPFTYFFPCFPLFLPGLIIGPYCGIMFVQIALFSFWISRIFAKLAVAALPRATVETMNGCVEFLGYWMYGEKETDDEQI
jgi:hypothetical protein